MIIVDGKKIAEELKLEIKEKLDTTNKLKMVAVLVGDNPVSANYVKYKKSFGANLGVEVVMYEFEDTISQIELEQEILKLADDDSIDGIIVQLPLPLDLDTKKILSLIPTSKDVDALGEVPTCLSPVVRAVSEILTRYEVEVMNKNIVVIGDGKLVGRPVAIWLASLGAQVTQVKNQQSVEDLTNILQKADIIISGVGKPGLVTKEMIREGVILIDAATSEEGGKLTGDISKDCLEKSALFTPVPGGLGPITMAMLFMNLVDLN